MEVTAPEWDSPSECEKESTAEGSAEARTWRVHRAVFGWIKPKYFENGAWLY